MKDIRPHEEIVAQYYQLSTKELRIKTLLTVLINGGLRGENNDNHDEEKRELKENLKEILLEAIPTPLGNLSEEEIIDCVDLMADYLMRRLSYEYTI